jgi:8-oxo-dGTP pyrophosphatase MutT (NUDIX family)
MAAHPAAAQEALKNIDVVKPMHESLRTMVTSGRNVLTSPGQALQQELSYPVHDLDLDAGDEDETHSQPSRIRPRVYIQKSRRHKPRLATYGFGMFMAAKINFKKPLLVVRQDMKTYDIYISSVQSLDWLTTLEQNQACLQEKSDPEDEDSNVQDSLNIVPAGSFSYRHSAMGTIVRTILRCHSLAMGPRKMLGKKFSPVRVAAVVIPRVEYKGETHLMITQRVHKKKGTYNDMYVFPGGHVEAGETLAQGALREFQEETGLDMEISTMKLVCCWQEVLPAKGIQFLMLVYSGDVSVPKERKSGEFEWDDLCLQNAEVATLALLPERTWEAVGIRGNCQEMLEAVHYEPADQEDQVGTLNQDGECNTVLRHVQIPANDVTGYKSHFGAGIGSGHRFALMQYVRPFDRNVLVNVKTTSMRSSRLGEIGSRLSKLRRSFSSMSESSEAQPSEESGSVLESNSTQLSIRLSAGGDIVGLSRSLVELHGVNPSFERQSNKRASRGFSL